MTHFETQIATAKKLYDRMLEQLDHDIETLDLDEWDVGVLNFQKTNILARLETISRVEKAITDGR